MPKKKVTKIPKAMQEAIGIDVDTVDELKEKIALDILPEVEEVDISKVAGGHTMGVSRDAIKKRNDFIVDLRLMGMNKRNIMKQVNARHEKTQWGLIKNEGTIGKIVAKHYNNNKESIRDMSAYEEGSQDAHYEQMETVLEKMMIHVSKKDKERVYVRTNKKGVEIYTGAWKPFEYMAALESVHKVQQNIAENRNWNASKKNPFALVQTNNIFNLISAADADYMESQKDGISESVTAFKEFVKKNKAKRESEDVVDAEIIE